LCRITSILRVHPIYSMTVIDFTEVLHANLMLVNNIMDIFINVEIARLSNDIFAGDKFYHSTTNKVRL